jgi:hypothetical protein
MWLPEQELHQARGVGLGQHVQNADPVSAAYAQAPPPGFAATCAILAEVVQSGSGCSNWSRSVTHTVMAPMSRTFVSSLLRRRVDRDC